MKTTLLCFLLVSGLFGLSFSCCGDRPSYWNLTSFQVEVMDFDRTTLPINDTISTDALILALSFGQEFLSDHINLGSNPFINSAYATSCPDYGELGMKDELVAIDITSSAPFNNYLPESSLVPMLFVGSQPLQDWIDNKSYNYSYSDVWHLLLPEKPSASSNTHDFKIRLTFDSGRVEEVQLGALTWI
jgi:hypothetical protein